MPSQTQPFPDGTCAFTSGNVYECLVSLYSNIYEDFSLILLSNWEPFSDCHSQFGGCFIIIHIIPVLPFSLLSLSLGLQVKKWVFYFSYIFSHVLFLLIILLTFLNISILYFLISLLIFLLSYFSTLYCSLLFPLSSHFVHACKSFLNKSSLFSPVVIFYLLFSPFMLRIHMYLFIFGLFLHT